MPAAPARAARLSGTKTRVRSSCESRTLSYSGRNRTGAGVPGSGRGASGRSNSSRPRSSRNVTQLRPEPLDDLAQPGQPRPRRHVGDRRGTERAEVAQHGRVERRLRGQRPAEPRLGGRVGDLRRRAPDAARRHLHAGQLAAAGVGERSRIRRGERSCERFAQLRSGARPLRVRARARTRARAPGRPPAAAGELGVACDLGVDHRLHQRAQHQAVVRAEQVDRRAHRRDAHGRRSLEERRRAPQAGTRRAATRARCRDRAGPAPACRRGARSRRAPAVRAGAGATGARASRGSAPAC